MFHLGAYTSQPWKTEPDGSESLEPALKAFQHVLELGVEAEVDVVAIAGDFFDHVRVKQPYVEATGELMEAVGRPVVVLPGNHDPHMPEGIYQKFADAFPANVHINRLSRGRADPARRTRRPVLGPGPRELQRLLPRLRLAGLGQRLRPLHLASRHGPRLLRRHRRVALLLPDFTSSEIAALSADYVALGHIDVHEGVGDGTIPAYYPGAPRHSGGATIVDFSAEGVTVRHELHEGADSDPQTANPMLAARLH